MDLKQVQENFRNAIAGDQQWLARWTIVGLGVIVLLRMKLILFAIALPVLAYTYFSQQLVQEAELEGGGDDEDDRQEATQCEDGGEDENVFDVGVGVNEDEIEPQSPGDIDIYDSSFWQDGAGTGLGGQGGSLSRSAAPFDDGDSAGRSGGPRQDEDFGLGSIGSLAGFGDFDFGGIAFGGGGGGIDLDFLGGSNAGKVKGKGKGKGKGKEEKGPREADPKQVFVTGIGDANDDDLRDFFTDVGEVDRVKVLREPDGRTKGVCFVTFREEAQALAAMGLHGALFDGKILSIRFAHGGNKGEKDDGKGKGGGGDRGDRGLDSLDLGGSDRFGPVFGFGGDGERGERRGKGKQKGGGRKERGQLDDLLEEALEDVDGPLRPGDFDFAAKRFLGELRSRDRSDGTERFQEALDMVFKYTASKDRSAVKKWPAYVFTLLSKFDPELATELRDRDAERRAQKGCGGKGCGGRDRDD